jgi:hypothetical protein
MKAIRDRTAIGFVYLLSLLIALPCRAQQVVVLPDVTAENVQPHIDNEVLRATGIERWVLGELQLSAWLLPSDGSAPVNVTNAVTWSLIAGDHSSITPTGLVTTTADEHIIVVASLGTIDSEVFHIMLGEPGAGDGGLPPGSPFGGEPPYSRPRVKEIIHDSLDQLQSAGLDSTPWRDSLNRVVAVDGNDWLIPGFLNSETGAIFVDGPGVAVDGNHGWFMQRLTAIATTRDAVIIQHQWIKELDDNGAINPTHGGARQSFLFILHELLHEIIDEYELDFAQPVNVLPDDPLFDEIDNNPKNGVISPVEAEEHFVRSFEQVLSLTMQIVRILEDGQLNGNEAVRLGVLARKLSKLILDLRALYAYLNEFVLLLLGLIDNDNGIPNFIDGMLWDMDIDPASLLGPPVINPGDPGDPEEPIDPWIDPSEGEE